MAIGIPVGARLAAIYTVSAGVAGVAGGQEESRRNAHEASACLASRRSFRNHRERGLPTVVGRLFNTVGPRQTGQYGMVVPTFVRQALAGQA